MSHPISTSTLANANANTNSTEGNGPAQRRPKSHQEWLFRHGRPSEETNLGRLRWVYPLGLESGGPFGGLDRAFLLEARKVVVEEHR